MLNWQEAFNGSSLAQPPVFFLNGIPAMGMNAAYMLAHELGWFYGVRRPAWLEHTIKGFQDGDYTAPFIHNGDDRPARLWRYRKEMNGRWGKKEGKWKHRFYTRYFFALERFNSARGNDRLLRYWIPDEENARLLWRKGTQRDNAKKRDKRRNEARAEKAWMNEGNYVHRAAIQYDFWESAWEVDWKDFAEDYGSCDPYGDLNISGWSEQYTCKALPGDDCDCDECANGYGFEEY